MSRTILTDLFSAAVDAVRGDAAVANFLEQSEMARPDRVLAVGKAAAAMFQGLPTDWQETLPALIATKTDHLSGLRFGTNVQTIEAAHPVPNEASLRAGAMAVDFVRAAEASDHLLVLVSGGASSVVEKLSGDLQLADLTALTQQALSQGCDIATINARRKEVSEVKGGKLLAQFSGRKVSVLAISDVEGDSIHTIGSGIGACPENPAFAYTCDLVATNEIAREAAANLAVSQGSNVVQSQENLYLDVVEAADTVAQEVLNGARGVYVFGGEPTVVLPENPGQGGRNQALALELSKRFAGRANIIGLVAGTDGTDGPTEAAGGFVDGEIYADTNEADKALRDANSGSYLAKANALFVTGPTGTNVMDLTIILKS